MSRLSLVIITRNRRHLLERNLPRHLASLPGDSPPSDLIVVDNGSVDGTARWLAETSQSTVLALRENVGSDGRLVGAAMAKTRYVAFSDDDSWWEPGALEEACDVLDAMPGVGLLAGSSYIGSGARPDPLNRVMEASPLEGPEGTTAVLGFMAFAAVARREALLAAQTTSLGMGSEEALIAIDIAAAGWSLTYRPELRAFHQPEQTDDRSGREVNVARNAIAMALARRRGFGMLGAVRRVVASLGPTAAMAATWRLPALLPWIVRSRRPVPLDIESDLRAIEAARAT